MSDRAEWDWETITRRLCAPFDPQDVDFRPQGNPEPNKKCQVVCYVEARAVADRLDEVVSAGGWSFDYTPLLIEKGEIQLAKGTLTIHGVSKSDVGDASSFAASKGCVSDALKRCAVLWGVGRYLYDVPSAYVAMDEYKRIPEGTLRQLRSRLPRPDGVSANASEHDAPAPEASRAPTPLRQPQQPATTRATASEDPAAAIVAPALQSELKVKICEAYNLTSAEALQKWLNEHVRAADAPRGPIDALALKNGNSNINGAELLVARELVATKRKGA